ARQLARGLRQLDIARAGGEAALAEIVAHDAVDALDADQYIAVLGERDGFRVEGTAIEQRRAVCVEHRGDGRLIDPDGAPAVEHETRAQPAAAVVDGEEFVVAQEADA